MGCQPLHRCIASHAFLLLDLLVAIIIALRSSINDGCSIRNVGLQKITLRMKETFLCNLIVLYLLFYFIILWLLFVSCTLYWNSTPEGGVVLLILTCWNYFPCGFAQPFAPSLALTNMCILFCLPTSVGEHPFPSSLTVAWWGVCGPLGEAQLGIEHEHFPAEQRWRGWMLDPSGREETRQDISILYSEGVLPVLIHHCVAHCEAVDVLGHI